MQGNCGQGENAAKDRIPIQDAGIRAGSPVRPERKEKVVIRADGNATDDIPESGSKKDGEQDT
jgi:hypothetical protein